MKNYLLNVLLAILSSCIPYVARAADNITLTPIGRLGTGTPYSIDTQGQYAYIAAGSGLSIVNISNPANPELIHFVDTPGYNATNIAVDGNYAYVGVDDYGIRVIDIGNPLTASEVGHYLSPNNT